MDCFETITVGKFIELLERQDPNHTITFDFCNFVPTDFDSYRGFYDHLALGYSGDQKVAPRVSELLDKAKETRFQKYAGYKGGVYQMNPLTPLWCDNWGNSTSTAIIDIVDYGYCSKIITCCTKD